MHSMILVLVFPHDEAMAMLDQMLEEMRRKRRSAA
jgi:hypothetical protein